MAIIYKTIACKFDQSIEHGLIDAPLEADDAKQFLNFIRGVRESAKRQMPTGKTFYDVTLTRQDHCEAELTTCAVTKQPAQCYTYKIEFSYV